MINGVLGRNNFAIDTNIGSEFYLNGFIILVNFDLTSDKN